MDFGLSFLPDCTGTGKNPAEYFKEAMLLAMIADQSGMKYVKMTEHYLHPYGGYCPSPLSFLSAVAAKTKQIRLMTGCLLPVFHHPIQLAAEIGMVDALSEGRLDVGFARAYLPYEFEALGIEIDESRQRYTSNIEAMLHLWTDKTSSHSSPFFSFTDVKSMPQCTQKPHPPIWGAAVNSRQTFAFLAENLFNLLVTPPLGDPKRLVEHIGIYRDNFIDAAAELGRDVIPQVVMSVPLIIAESNSEALILGEKYLDHYLRIWTDAAKSILKSPSKDYPNYDFVYKTLKNLTPAMMMQKNHAFIGTADRVRELVEEFKEYYSLDGLIFQIDFGEQPFEISKRTLTQFVKKVMNSEASFNYA